MSNATLRRVNGRFQAGYFDGKPNQRSRLRYTPDGMAICNFGIAVNDSYRRGSDGDAKDETMFIDVATFRKQAENCGQYLKKEDEFSLKDDYDWNDGKRKMVLIEVSTQ